MKLRDIMGATPLDSWEMEGLIPSDIATQDQLNQAEQSNILETQNWALNKKHREVLSESFLRKLHHRMFCWVWKWAGQYRKAEKNLGLPWVIIPEELNKLISDTHYWINHQTYSWDELGARFHHRLVSIHPFPNGNGRHARLMTDVLLVHQGQERFSWGQKSMDRNFSNAQEVRKLYITNLRQADDHYYEGLIRFVRS